MSRPRLARRRRCQRECEGHFRSRRGGEGALRDAGDGNNRGKRPPAAAGRPGRTEEPVSTLAASRQPRRRHGASDAAVGRPRRWTQCESVLCGVSALTTGPRALPDLECGPGTASPIPLGEEATEQPPVYLFTFDDVGMVFQRWGGCLHARPFLGHGRHRRVTGAAAPLRACRGCLLGRPIRAVWVAAPVAASTRGLTRGPVSPGASSTDCLASLERAGLTSPVISASRGE